MSMDLGGAKGGVKSDINVTPLVDVMLVLLIIMMLIAPMLQSGVNVKMPEAANTVAKPDVDEITRLQHLLGRLGEAAFVAVERRQGEKTGKPSNDADEQQGRKRVPAHTGGETFIGHKPVSHRDPPV